MHLPGYRKRGLRLVQSTELAEGHRLELVGGDGKVGAHKRLARQALVGPLQRGGVIA